MKNEFERDDIVFASATERHHLVLQRDRTPPSRPPARSSRRVYWELDAYESPRARAIRRRKLLSCSGVIRDGVALTRCMETVVT
jgi:hypothetical protein